MTDQPIREPRLERARKRLKPQPAWVGVYESYEAAEEPWPMEAIAIVLYGQGIIWAQGGNPNISVLCQIMAQTDTGVEIDVENDVDTVWQTLIASLENLPWGKPVHSRDQAFFAAASILADILRKTDITRRVSEQSEVTANEVLQDVYGGIGTPAEPDVNDEELAGVDVEPMMMDGTEEALEELRQQLQEPAEEG